MQTRYALVPDQTTNIAQLWELGQASGATHFWVPLGSLADRRGADFSDVETPYRVFPLKTNPDGRMKFARVWREDVRHGHSVYVGYAHRLPFDWKVRVPGDILLTARYLTHRLGIPVEWSPLHMGRDLLKLLYRDDRRGIIADTTEDLRDLPFYGAARDLAWMRPLLRNMVGLYLHAFDKNSAYLSACRQVTNGYGDPVHVTQDIKPGVPGIYRVSINRGSPTFDGVQMPALLEKRQEWLNHDMLAFARSQGYDIDVIEAYQFTGRGKQVLDEWAKTLWEARIAFRTDRTTYPDVDAAANAAATINLIAHVGVGGFATKQVSQPNLTLIHPNWWGDAVNKTRINMLCNIQKNEARAGAPILIYSDAVYYVSSSPDPLSCAPGVLDPNKLGAYKTKWPSYEITADLWRRSRSLDEGELATLFKNRAMEVAR